MAIEPGDLLASGRAADVFDQGDGTVLRRYRTEHDCEPEGRLMSWLDDAGFPVPAIHHAAGRDLIMARVRGPTMLEDLDRRPWAVFAHMRTLADLQKSLNAMTAPSWVGADQRIPAGSSLVHLDLHPMNVIIGPEGPVVIDWTNAGRGDGDFDAALTYVLMATYEATGLQETIAQHVVKRLFRRLRGAGAIQRCLVDAGNFRLQDRNVTAGERAAISTLLARRQRS